MTDYFDLLGLPRRYAVDAATLEREYLSRSRELHPDYHQAAAASEQRASLELSAGLNEAYSTLRDPHKRAEYLLKIEGGPSASEHKQMPAEFLEEQLALRMEIEELREAADPPALAAMEAKLAARRDRIHAEVAARFAGYETAGAAERKALLVEVRQLLNTAKYIQGQFRDLRAD